MSRKNQMQQTSSPTGDPAAAADGFIGCGPPASGNGNGALFKDPADPSAIFKEIWAINGPFEEPWVARFNADDVWGHSQAWWNSPEGVIE